MAAESNPEAKSSKEVEPPATTVPSSTLFKKLIILPPLQKSGSLSRDDLLDSVPLPPLRAEEPVSSIRAALSEVCGYAHLTNYRLVLEIPPTQLPTKTDAAPKLPLVSPYTGPNAVVSVPTTIKSLETEPQAPFTSKADVLVLDDYGDLTSLVDSGLKDGSAFRIVLEKYDVALVRDHVTRLRSLLDGNAPSTTTLDETVADLKSSLPTSAEETSKESGGSTAKTKHDPATSEITSKGNHATKADENSENPTDSNPTLSDQQESTKSDPAKPDSIKAGEDVKPPRDLPRYLPDEPVKVDGGNLKKFFYLACGEDPALYSDDSAKRAKLSKKENGSKSSKKKSKKGKDKSKEDEEDKGKDAVSNEETMRETIPRLNTLEERTRVECIIRLSGFHPPPQFRRLMGDLAYLEITPPQEKNVIHITAVPTGFFVNKSSSLDGSHRFDPSPAPEPCFSHELLDCLLKCSASFRRSWEDALEASKERISLMTTLNKDGPFSSLFRVAIRGDFEGYSNPTTASAAEGIDALLQSPSWIVPMSRVEEESESAWNRNAVHAYNVARTEDELSNSFGVDIRSGAVRDWNEELQTAREMPVETLPERVERARVMNKVLVDFGEASVLGVKAIFDGQIAPMNPNEATRSQVYLHNNIFFSRAVDAGVETFKIAKGDRAARKSASRDVLCLGALHRMERTGLHTLATVLVDYLGARFVCQSILPGILSGEKTHTLLYGAVEAGSPLMWDSEMHSLLENTLGKGLMIATRPLPREPLTEERAAEIQEFKCASPLHLPIQDEEKKSDEDAPPSIAVCAPIEAKGIQGSDQRKYVLDMTRLTPRDANWVAESSGGTGKWEAIFKPTQKSSNIPLDVDDDEWTLAVLRPELITNFTQVCMAKYLNAKNFKESTKGKDDDKSEEVSKEDSGEENGSKPVEGKDGEESSKEPNIRKQAKAVKSALSEEDLDYLKSLRFNVNVFLPDIKSLKGIDDDAVEQIRKDEEMARRAAKFLWDEVIPRLTTEIRDGSGHQIPQDGRSLTEYLHQHGINCRYLGRLASLAQKEEELDRIQLESVQQGKAQKLSRRVMPLFWLELLECEMVARSAKHVLDSYLNEHGGTGATSPSQIIASFLCALVSEGEETAAQTESRVGRVSGPNGPDEDDFNALTIGDTGGGGDSVPSSIRSRTEVWNNIERDIGRRFRYSLILHNRVGKTGRALYLPLLRRVCQRTGVRLAAKNYEFGGKGLCNGGTTSAGQMTCSYPISALDIVDIVPLMKHSAAHGEGFVPCGYGGTAGYPALHISLQDARATLEAAHLHHSARALSHALDLAQEACSLYQRVTETPAHPGVVRCLDLIATILFDAGEPGLASANAVKALGLLVQVSGFDSPDVISAHLVLFQMLLSAGQLSRGVKHLRAAIYLMEVLGGPHNVELSNAYHKLGTLYHGVNDFATALRFYVEAGSRESSDRLLAGMVSKSTAMVLAGMGEFKNAVDNEKKAFNLFSSLLGEEHTLTRTSDQSLKKFMKMAVERGSKIVEDLKKRQEEEAADLIASEIEAAEAAEEERKKKKNNKNKKKAGKK